MMDLKMAGEIRQETGKNVAGKVRNAGFVPGVVYSKGEENIHVQVDEPEFRKVYREAGATTILALKVDSKELPVIIKEVQKDPIKDQFLHVDFQKVSMDEEIRVIVPITLVNRDDIKVQPSILSQQLDEIEIECLPQNLPDEIEINVEDMEIGDSITIADLDIAKDDKIIILRDLDDVICSLSEFIEEDVDAIDDEEEFDAEPELVSDEDEDDDEDEE